MSETMGLDEYIERQVYSGIFAETSAFPENDPRVLKAYQSMVIEALPQDKPPALTLYFGKHGFYRDSSDAERIGLNWAMTTPIIDMGIGVSFAEFVRDLPALQEAVSEPVLTDTFSFLDGYGALEHPVPGLLRLNSPVADIAMDFAAYLETLTSDRRKKYRRMVSDFEKTPLRFEMSERPLDSSEISFIRRNLEKKWGDDWDYAYRQSLWAIAVQKYRPEQSLVMRVYARDVLVFLQTMIIKGGHVYCQSITKNEDEFYSGLAAFTDFKCIEQLCGKYTIFDPSCRTSLDDPESIGVAKRATVNKNLVKPLLSIKAGADAYDEVIGKEA